MTRLTITPLERQTQGGNKPEQRTGQNGQPLSTVDSVPAHLSLTERDLFRIMTDTNLKVWGVWGYDTKQCRYNMLNYATETKAEAYAKAKHNYPTLDIEAVTFVADFK